MEANLSILIEIKHENLTLDFSPCKYLIVIFCPCLCFCQSSSTEAFESRDRPLLRGGEGRPPLGHRNFGLPGHLRLVARHLFALPLRRIAQGNTTNTMTCILYFDDYLVL
jgi:hypothetical protein